MDDKWIDIIKNRAETIRSGSFNSDEPIRDNIFKLLRDKSVLVFYPLEDEKDLDGFHVDRVIDGQIKPFVYINTANYWDKCIFCAAHELGHVYRIETCIKESCPDSVINDAECDEIMNRFAAELLMPETKFKSKFSDVASRIFNKKDKGIKEQDILRIAIELMDFFFVPYKAVIKRLNEIGFLTDLGVQHYIEYNDLVIKFFIADGDFIRPNQITNLKQFDNLEDLIRKTQNKSSLNTKAIDVLCRSFDISFTDKVDELIEQTSQNILNENLYNTGEQ